MKRFLIVAGIIVALALLILVGKLLFKHFITDQIKDRGGMENPFTEEETENPTSPSDTEEA